MALVLCVLWFYIQAAADIYERKKQPLWVERFLPANPESAREQGPEKRGTPKHVRRWKAMSPLLEEHVLLNWIEWGRRSLKEMRPLKSTEIRAPTHRVLVSKVQDFVLQYLSLVILNYKIFSLNHFVSTETMSFSQWEPTQQQPVSRIAFLRWRISCNRSGAPAVSLNILFWWRGVLWNGSSYHMWLGNMYEENVHECTMCWRCMFWIQNDV